MYNPNYIYIGNIIYMIINTMLFIVSNLFTNLRYLYFTRLDKDVRVFIPFDWMYDIQ